MHCLFKFTPGWGFRSFSEVTLSKPRIYVLCVLVLYSKYSELYVTTVIVRALKRSYIHLHLPRTTAGITYRTTSCFSVRAQYYMSICVCVFVFVCGRKSHIYFRYATSYPAPESKDNCHCVALEFAVLVGTSDNRFRLEWNISAVGWVIMKL